MHNKHQQPAGFWAIFTAQLFFSFGLAGLLSLFILYLVNSLHITESLAYLILGGFFAFYYVLPVLGGYLTDRYLSSRWSIQFGVSAIVFGLLVLSVSYLFHGLFYWGISLIIVGHAFYFPNIIKIVSQLYPKRGSRREGGYAFFHAATMIGATVAPIVCGVAVNYFSSQVSFILMGVLVLLGLFCFMISSRRLGISTIEKLSIKKITFSLLLFLILVASITLILMHNHWIPYLFESLVLLAAIYFIWILKCASTSERNNLVSIVVLMLFFIVFEIGARQCYGLLTLFAEHYVNRQLFGYTISAASFQGLEPLFVILLSPLFVWWWQSRWAKRINLSSSNAFVIGLTAMAISFGSLQLVSYLAGPQHSISMDWLVLSSGLNAISEICMIPIGYALITRLAPERFRGIVIGYWVVSMGIGGYLSTQVTHFVGISSVTATNSLGYYQAAFGDLAFISIASALLLLASKFFFPQKTSSLSL